MRMQTDTYPVYTYDELSPYTYDELSPEIKQKVLEKLYDINVDFQGWEDDVIDNYTKELEGLGYRNIKIYYSGFNSQGDGAMFEATIQAHEWMKAHKLSNKYKKFYNYAVNGHVDPMSFNQSGHYYHEYSLSVTDFYLDSYDKRSNDKTIIDQCASIEALIEQERLDMCQDLYRALEREYNYLTSEEVIIETIKANDYEFTEQGALI